VINYFYYWYLKNLNDNNNVRRQDKTASIIAYNDCYKYIMDLTTNGVVITDAIKFVQTNKEKLSMSTKEDDKESKEPDYDEDNDKLEEKQEEESGETQLRTANRVF
jgi:hypothetical protein